MKTFEEMTGSEVLAAVNEALKSAPPPLADLLLVPPSVYWGVLRYPVLRQLGTWRVRRRRPRFARRVLSRRWRG